MSKRLEHNPEPWIFVFTAETAVPSGHVDASGGGLVAVLVGSASKADGRRIVACVNACAEMRTEALESGALAKALKALTLYVHGTTSPASTHDEAFETGIAAIRSLWGKAR